MFFDFAYSLESSVVLELGWQLSATDRCQRFYINISLAKKWTCKIGQCIKEATEKHQTWTAASRGG